MTVIRSNDNPRVKSWMRLATEARERRKQGLALLEGVHLVEALLGSQLAPESLLVCETAIDRGEIRHLIESANLAPVCLSEAVFNRISDADTPTGIAAIIRIPPNEITPSTSDGCVLLEGIQDAGNVGTIIRSAAAFGIRDVMLGRGCADPWSPKALRAGMGGHFLVRIAAGGDLAEAISAFGESTVCTVAKGGVAIDEIDLRGRIAWIFGSEGAGVSDAVAALATYKATIAMPGGTESLNVAASAAICLYEQARQLSKRGARS